MSQADLSRLETQIGRLLRTGVAVAASVLGLGLVLWVFDLSFSGRVLSAGLVLLMAIPVARIGASFVEAVRQRDQILIWSTAIVLLVMAITLVMSLASS